MSLQKYHAVDMKLLNYVSAVGNNSRAVFFRVAGVYGLKSWTEPPNIKDPLRHF